MNRLIANIGAKAFFSMLMKHNFVHADCHAGNILVRIKESPNAITNYMYSIANRVTSYVLAKIIKYGMNSDFLRRLSE
jgi:predicted unusual protein kinase regulating ubiquinone biosynthesis (AarF/ABC1/UbiB family)